jgi:crossover junction endodeoxyribonuclease RusA
MKLVTTWPARELWPNARGHWAVVKRHRDQQRFDAWVTACEAGLHRCGELPDRIPVTLTFRRATRHPYDLDNALAAMKGALDGISQAIGADDSRFDTIPVHGTPTPGGAVEITVGVLA